MPNQYPSNSPLSDTPLPSEPDFQLDPRKVAFGGGLVGAAFAALLFFLIPLYDSWRTLERARTQVQVQRILGTCK